MSSNMSLVDFENMVKQARRKEEAAIMKRLKTQQLFKNGMQKAQAVDLAPDSHEHNQTDIANSLRTSNSSVILLCLCHFV